VTAPLGAAAPGRGPALDRLAGLEQTLGVGAEPLFFLDYLALGKDDPDLIATLVAGVSTGW